jgi:hypothetical protein
MNSRDMQLIYQERTKLGVLPFESPDYAAHLPPKAPERSQTSRLAIVAGNGHDRSRSSINVAA